MSTPRDRRDSKPVDLYPQLREGPECHQAMHERYHKQRWIVRLDQHVKVVSHCLECGTTACTRQAVVDRPLQEEALA